MRYELSDIEWWGSDKQRQALRNFLIPKAKIHKALTIKQGERLPKGWGHEEIIHNGEECCGKILHYKKGGKSSTHFHLIKSEFWRVLDGIFKLTYIDMETADRKEAILIKGNVIDIYHGCVHGIECVEEGSILEVSSQHFDSDSYRIEKGDSQANKDEIGPDGV